MNHILQRMQRWALDVLCLNRPPRFALKNEIRSIRRTVIFLREYDFYDKADRLEQIADELAAYLNTI